MIRNTGESMKNNAVLYNIAAELQNVPPQTLPKNYVPYNINKTTRSTVVKSVAPPPLPPRSSSAFIPRFNSYSSGRMLNSFSRFPNSMYSPLYGRLRSNLDYYGSSYEDIDNSFIQLAEESTRPAFQSIETIVEAVSSISMMLESTYHAVYSCYSAILGVVDNFSRLKEHFAQMLSLLTLLRGLQWLCLKVLYALGVVNRNPSEEAAWTAAQTASNSSQVLSPIGDANPSKWPVFIFIGLVFGAPWLMARIFSNVAKKSLDSSHEKEECRVAVALYDFVASRSDELSFHAGQKLSVAPKSKQKKINGWLVASDGKSSGLIPSNYVKVKRVVLVQTSAERSVLEKKPLQPNVTEVASTSNTQVFEESFTPGSTDLPCDTLQK